MPGINKWLYPGIKIKRWIFLFVLSIIVIVVGLSGIIGSMVKNVRIESINVDNFFYHLQGLKFIDVFLLLLGIGGIALALRRVYFSVLAIFVPNSGKDFINIAYKKAKLKRGPKITTIGGGTGLPNVLRGLKGYTLNLSAVVTVADDGGSSGRLRKDYQVLPPGDIRNCIVALADEEALLGKLFQYRFENGGELAGHNFGNIFITALTHVVGGDFSKAIIESSKVLAIHGSVLPVSLDHINLRAEFEDGREVTGESKIPEAKGKIKKLSVVPEDCKPYKPAMKAIKNADAVVIGPGSLYTSILPNLLVPGITDVLMNGKAMKIYICNIMTQHGETDNYTVSDHLKSLFKHTGEKVVDFVIANSKIPSSDVLKRYAEENSTLVEIDRAEITALGVKLIEGDLFEDDEYIRHSEEMLGKLIMKTMIL